MQSKRSAIVAAVALVAVMGFALLGYNALAPALASQSDAGAGQADVGAGAGQAGVGASSVQEAGAESIDGSAEDDGQAPRVSSAERAASQASAAASSVAFPVFTVNDSQNNLVAFSSMKGKPIVIGFWATWCPNCVVEAPAIQQLYDTYGDRVNFMMIDVVDGYRETMDVGSEWIADNGFTYPVYYDVRQEAVRAGAVAYLPKVFVLDAAGNVVTMLPSGFSVEEASEVFDQLLSSP